LCYVSFWQIKFVVVLAAGDTLETLQRPVDADNKWKISGGGKRTPVGGLYRRVAKPLVASSNIIIRISSSSL